MKKLLITAFVALTFLSFQAKDNVANSQTVDNLKDVSDSLRMDDILKNALSIAVQNKDKASFTDEYQVEGDEVYNPTKVFISLGNLFSANHKHLFIKRTVEYGDVLIDLYLFKNNKFELVNHNEQSYNTFMSDEIRDINGDGYKDLDIHWYPLAGCCLKNIHDVYLLNPKNGTFKKKVEFMNPTFYPREGLIRGLTYGYSGMDAALYTIKWKGSELEGVEGIYQAQFIEDPEYQVNDEALKNVYYRITAKGDSTKINSIPNEYLTIDQVSLNWFKGGE
ncbi:hypothetical protein [Dysgonomonas sp. ZJ709]|uniref:hypothetical protein n=1 Tax=Dysgonomonas sp. ZJ709 TaxID=2709797 RepID=UPI0013E9EA50|nr:hypothetical protein [Dysgonomonas sp. ZJ709]